MMFSFSLCHFCVCVPSHNFSFSFFFQLATILQFFEKASTRMRVPWKLPSLGPSCFIILTWRTDSGEIRKRGWSVSSSSIIAVYLRMSFWQRESFFMGPVIFIFLIDVDITVVNILSSYRPAFKCTHSQPFIGIYLQSYLTALKCGYRLFPICSLPLLSFHFIVSILYPFEAYS